MVKQSLEAHGQGGSWPEMLLAIVHHRLNQVDEVRVWLENAGPGAKSN